MEKMNYPTTSEGKKQMEEDGEKIMEDNQKKESEERKKTIEDGFDLALSMTEEQINNFVFGIEKGREKKARDLYEKVKKEKGYDMLFIGYGSGPHYWLEEKIKEILADKKERNDSKKLKVFYCENSHKDKVERYAKELDAEDLLDLEEVLAIECSNGLIMIRPEDQKLENGIILSLNDTWDYGSCEKDLRFSAKYNNRIIEQYDHPNIMPGARIYCPEPELDFEIFPEK